MMAHLVFMSYFIQCILLLQRFAFSTKPNIVILMVDDLGVADLGCFGNDTLKTPNIDKLSSQGARLTHSLSSESICTPSRAAFLTGRYAVRTGLAAGSNQTRVLMYTSAPGGLPRNESTFAKLLSNAGYYTGMFGKWHLGLNKRFANDFHYHPLNHGFHLFYGIPFTNYFPCTVTAFNLSAFLQLLFPFILVMVLVGIITWYMAATRTLANLCFTLTLVFLVSTVIIFSHGISVERFPYIQKHMDCFLMKNFDVVEQPIWLENLTVRLTNQALQFISQSKATPFMLFMSYVKVHTPLFTSKAFQGHSGHSKYGDNVEEMDWSVGKIVDELDRLGIRNNTFVYFTSDHGPDMSQVVNGEYHGGWKGNFKGSKGQSWEGGIRVPSIASWPSHIPAGIEVTEPTISVDIFPTILNIANVSIPDDRIIDGKDIMPLLQQNAQYTPNTFMFHYCAKELHAVRYRPQHGTTTWKAHFITPKWLPGKQTCHTKYCKFYGDDVNTHNPPLLYNITGDPYEDHPITSNDPSYKSVIEAITQAVHDHQRSLTTVPNQLDNNYWFPWRQTCCNYPYCSCKET